MWRFKSSPPHHIIMKKPLHLIYITGLGDRNVTGQRRAVATWHLWGVEAELFQVNWGDKEAWEPKFKRLLARIDALLADDKQVGLVAVSAGATAAINAFAVRKDEVVGVVCIAGKINRPGAIGQRYRQNNPAFLTSAQDCQQALATLNSGDRQRILSRYGLADEMVSTSDSRLPGARNRYVLSAGHFVTIALQITLGAPGFIRFLKRKTV
jgi:pimeloyl-ACP methyl ester carboxylesterase